MGNVMKCTSFGNSTCSRVEDKLKTIRSCKCSYLKFHVTVLCLMINNSCTIIAYRHYLYATAFIDVFNNVTTHYEVSNPNDEYNVFSLQAV